VRKIERALISVYDKTGIVEFARGLAALQVEILATGSTSKLLSASGIPVRDVADYTGFPEILDGRVKTLHPRIAGGLLAIRSNPEHMRQVEQNRIQMIDLVCVNLYPFAETIRKEGVSFEEVIENIDIGGPSMIRAAAKNFQDVAVLTSPEDYDAVLEALKSGIGVLDREMLFSLSRKAFLCTARYDAQVAHHLSTVGTSDGGSFPTNLFMDFEKISDLRYGENPHQKAAFYRWGGRRPFGLAASRQLQGKELSYNNIVDVEAALELVREFEEPACCVIKHTNPCGTASAATLKEAYVKAYEADSVSAFGSVIGFNRKVDAATANELSKLFVEAVVAPEEVVANDPGAEVVADQHEVVRDRAPPRVDRVALEIAVLDRQDHLNHLALLYLRRCRSPCRRVELLDRLVHHRRLGRLAPVALQVRHFLD